MSWPSAWPTDPTQAATTQAAGTVTAMDMYQMTPEQQYALQQQNWQQWQIYQTQLAQWQAQYGEQYSKLMQQQQQQQPSTSAVPSAMPSAYMPNIPDVAPPPPPADSQPPPPPPPQTQSTENPQKSYTSVTLSSQPVISSVPNLTTNNVPNNNYNQQNYPQQNYPQPNYSQQNYSQYSQQSYQQPPYPQTARPPQSYTTQNQPQQNYQQQQNQAPPNQFSQQNQAPPNQFSQQNQAPPNQFSQQNQAPSNQFSQQNYSKQNQPQQNYSQQNETQQSQSQQNSQQQFQDGTRRNRRNRWGSSSDNVPNNSSNNDSFNRSNNNPNNDSFNRSNNNSNDDSFNRANNNPNSDSFNRSNNNSNSDSFNRANNSSKNDSFNRPNNNPNNDSFNRANNNSNNDSFNRANNNPNNDSFNRANNNFNNNNRNNRSFGDDRFGGDRFGGDRFGDDRFNRDYEEDLEDRNVDDEEEFDSYRPAEKYDDEYDNKYDDKYDDENDEKSAEEIAFDKQYRNWEDKFMDWKRNNANHPDRNQYNDFVVKMEGMRQQLLQRRETLRQKRLDAKQVVSNMPDASRSDESTSQPIQMNPQQTNEPQVTNTVPQSIELVRESSSAALFANRGDSEAGIPGLDLVSEASAELLASKRDPNVVPAPKRDSNAVPPPKRGSTAVPAQKRDQNVVPALETDSNALLAPKRDQNALPAPKRDQIVLPAPNRDQNALSAPNRDQNALSAPNRDQNALSAPNRNQNIVAHVNNILGNPKIQSLLSNIQKQQSVAAPPSLLDIKFSDEFIPPISSNSFNRSDNVVGQFDGNQNMDMSQLNPFRQNKRSGGIDQPPQMNDEYDGNPKRGRFWNDNAAIDNPNSFDQINRDRGNFGQQNPNQPPKQNWGQEQSNNNRNRFKDMDAFNSPNNDFNSIQDDIEEFRPMQIIDYQNQPSNRAANQPPIANQPGFSGNFPMAASKKMPVFEYFPRKITNYDHKTKIHSWNWYCPIIQIEYNHTRNGHSLHALHALPPPKSVEKPVRNEPTSWVRQSKWPLAQSNSMSNERRDGKQFGKAQNPPQSQFQNRPTFPSQHANENQPYNRGNAPERNFPRNSQEWGNKSQNVRSYDRHSESSNMSQKNDMRMQSNTSTPYQQKDNGKKMPQCPRFNLKDLLYPPGRLTRPKKIVILMRGIPGSGKSYISKMIKDKEQELGGSARVLSIDDYFMAETDSDTANGQKTNNSEQMEYEFDPKMEGTYTQYLIKSFKKLLSDSLFNCVIVDCNNTTLQYLSEFYTIAKMHFFTPFVCEMPLDVEKCVKNNIHKRTEDDIRHAMNQWVPTPATYTLLEYDCLFKADNTEQISDMDVGDQDDKGDSLDGASDDGNANAKKESDDFSGEDESMNEFGIFKSKWDNDSTENKLARLDGINKPIKHATIEDYLQMDGWEPPPTSSNGKKRVRWADIEEKREHDKQRAIGFVVGQTNWDNLINQPRDHTQALTKVKYIEKIKKN